MALDKDEALDGAFKWLLSIREIARTDLAVANLLIDTQPDHITLGALAEVLDDPSTLTQTEKDLIRQEKKIQAIKEIRARTGLGLKECKVIADKWHDAERAAGRLPAAKSFAPVPASVAPASEFLTPPPLPPVLLGTTPRAFGSDETPFDPSVLARHGRDS